MGGCSIGRNLGLKLWGFLLLLLLIFFVCFCLDKCFSMIWMIDDSAFCSILEQSLVICIGSLSFEV